MKSTRILPDNIVCAFSREWPGLLVFSISALLYFCLTPDYVVGNDNGEFAALSRIGGIAHPPGYPVYVLYLRAMAWLPGTAAKSSAVATAVLGACQIGVIYAACRAWKIKPFFAAFGAAYYASSHLSLVLNTHAEVFALNNLFASVVVFLAGSPFTRFKPFYVLALTAFLTGLALSHHHSYILLMPLIIYIFASNIQAMTERLAPWHVAMLVMLFIFGLSPNFLLVYWSKNNIDNLNSWGNLKSIDSLLHHFLRRDYGTFSLSGAPRSVDLVGQQKLLLSSLYWSWNILLPFALIGFARPFSAITKGFTLIHGRWLALFLSIVTAGPLFVTRFNIGLEMPGPAILERFHFLPAILLVVPISSGIQSMVELVRRKTRSLGPSIGNEGLIHSLSASLFLLLPFCFNGLLAFRVWKDRSSPVIQDSLVRSLQALPKNSIILPAADHKVFGYHYLISVERYRPDVKIVSPALLRYEWYRRRLGLFGANNTSSAMARILGDSFAKGTPVFVDSQIGARFFGFKTYQLGLFRRIMPSTASMPPPASLLKKNLQVYSGYRRAALADVVDNGWSGLIQHDITMSWLALAKDLAAAGRADLARLAIQYSERYGHCEKKPCI